MNLGPGDGTYKTVAAIQRLKRPLIAERFYARSCAIAVSYAVPRCLIRTHADLYLCSGLAEGRGKDDNLCIVRGSGHIAQAGLLRRRCFGSATCAAGIIASGKCKSSCANQ